MSSTGAKYKAGKRVRTQRSGRGFWIIAVVVVAIGVAAVVAVSTGSKSKAKSPSGKSDPVSAATVLKRVASVPKTVFDRVGPGTATAAPKPVTAPTLTADGKPRIVYVGAEYCPYCATERWAIVTALARFGTFADVGLTHSADAPEVFPDTQTFTFHGSSYTSPYLSFTPVETTTVNHDPLDQLTAEEQQLLTKYDVPPYSGPDSSSAGAIPFLYFAGKYVSVGATYDPSLLQGKSASEIATALADPTSAIAKGAIGAANGLTAAICTVTADRPAAVCSDPVIRSLQGSLR